MNKHSVAMSQNSQLLSENFYVFCLKVG